MRPLSAGQRHTIFLTIAMLAESKIQLVIDQPEDDRDIAFMFSNIVTTLRVVKEKLQVILVTASRKRLRKDQNSGLVHAVATKQCVLDVLEGR